jgi:hypothetical protein
VLGMTSAGGIRPLPVAAPLRIPDDLEGASNACRDPNGTKNCACKSRALPPIQCTKEFAMNKKPLLVMAAGTLIAAGVAYAQFPIMDKVADKVIQKYQSSSCQQLWQEKAAGQGQPKPEMEQRVVKMLQQDPQMRQAFFAKISAPIVNKMFECGMIP